MQATFPKPWSAAVRGEGLTSSPSVQRNYPDSRLGAPTGSGATLGATSAV